MNFRISGLLAIAGFALAGILGSEQSLAQNAYITNNDSSNVSVIDTVTDIVIATVPVGGVPTGVVVTPDGSTVYVANNADATVSVIRTATNTVTATIRVGNLPVGVAATPDGSRVYVTNASQNTVSVISTATKTVTATIPLGGPNNNQPHGVAVTPDGSTVYVANAGSGTVAVIATASNTVTATISVGNVPQGVAVTPDGNKVYVVNEIDDTVSVIATASNTVTGTIPLPQPPQGVPGAAFAVAVTPDGNKVYVTSAAELDSFPSVVSVISTATDMVTTTIPVGNGAGGVSVTPDGSKVFVANPESNNVSVIDTATDTVIGSPISVGNLPVAFGIFIQPAPRFAGTPGYSNCHGQSVSALAREFGGLNAAAAALGFSSVQVLQNDIAAYCAG